MYNTADIVYKHFLTSMCYTCRYKSVIKLGLMFGAWLMQSMVKYLLKLG